MLLNKFFNFFAHASLVLKVAASPIVEKDVAIVGGGAAGAHAAIRLHDEGRSIVLIEKDSILGGHIDSFTDPETGRVYEYGVQNFIDTGNATGFFERIGVPLGPPGPRVPLTTRYVDFAKAVELNFIPPQADAQTAAFKRFLEIAEKYEPYYGTGYWEFPENVPEDLAMPFGDFAKKYQFEDAVHLIYRVTAYGTGDISKRVTLYVLQAFGASMARNFLGLQAALVPASHRNQDVYDVIANILGSDVMLSTTVVESIRTAQGITLVTKNSKSDVTTTIKAKKLLIAIEPHAANFELFHPTPAEQAIFGAFNWTRIVAGIVTNEALPANTSLFNLPSAAAPSNYLTYNDLPFQNRFDYMGQKYTRVLMIGDASTDLRSAQQTVQANFNRLIDGGILPAVEDRELQWVAVADHSFMHARVSGEELRNGFLKRQYALQGQQSTWFTGAAFVAQFQTTLWEYNDILLPKLMASL
ncbi:FAD/NAD(P)-binding domain-containing protein [Polyplosphaeria fusca]|uniref:FAD/NAD(P)-binding domain-containing protein n=1 Tax=Polyplosphaeria fusca TaxID=682080 RepID=A0A9P4QM33_9PLEO|nr:FAD/NAD(P)-binding domain-containing protein [Polyplosphaeria fusca]